MPDFIVYGPDNKAYDISGPEGSTREQALQVAPTLYAQGKLRLRESEGPQLSGALDIAGGANAGFPPAVSPLATQALGNTLQKVNPIPGLVDVAKTAREQSMGFAEGNPRVPAGGSLMAASMALTPPPSGLLPKAISPMAKITMEDVAKEATANYRDAAATNTLMSPTAAHSVLDAGLAKLGERFDEGAAQRVFDIIGNRKAKIGTEPVSAGIMEVMRQQLGRLKGTPMAPELGAASRVARDAIEEAIEQLPIEAFVSGQPEKYQELIKSGRGNTAAKHRLEDLETAGERARLNNTDVQSEYKALVMPSRVTNKSPAQRAGFNLPERRALGDVAQAGRSIDTAQKIIGQAGPYIPGLEFGANAIRGRLIGNAEQRAIDMVASRSPLFQKRQAEFLSSLPGYRAQGARDISGELRGILAAGKLGVLGLQQSQ